MSMRNKSKVYGWTLASVFVCSTITVFAAENAVHLGQPVTEAELQGWDLIVMPDGSGLPAGKGNAVQGRAVFEQQCAACHGVSGQGMAGVPALANEAAAEGDAVLRTVGNYWPYASTLFDYVRRAMPPTAPKSLSTEQVYQVVAYVLLLNGIVADDFELTNINLPTIEMPNHDGFVDRSQVQ